jgi:hypothetical protein
MLGPLVSAVVTLAGWPSRGAELPKNLREAHLHHTAIGDVVDVCDELARHSTGGGIVATHALEFLGRPDMVTAPLLVDNFTVQPVTPGLPELRSRAQHLGISPAMVLASARAVLCVEGESDANVLNALVGNELDRSYVHTLRLFGMNELADRLPELDLVYSLDIPVYLLLDHVRASKLQALLSGERIVDATKEERELLRLEQALRDRKATVIPMAQVDIVRSIPDEAMKRIIDRLGKSPGPDGMRLTRQSTTKAVGHASKKHSKTSREPR